MKDAKVYSYSSAYDMCHLVQVHSQFKQKVTFEGCCLNLYCMNTANYTIFIAYKTFKGNLANFLIVKQTFLYDVISHRLSIWFWCLLY